VLKNYFKPVWTSYLVFLLAIVVRCVAVARSPTHASQQVVASHAPAHFDVVTSLHPSLFSPIEKEPLPCLYCLLALQEQLGREISSGCWPISAGPIF
jgi:ABC-type transport system involved in cytochrome bd biosynthesis fused ATPase/permease subunit